MSQDYEKEMPLGLAFQMAMNEDAMNNFAKMTDDEKRQVMDKARETQSKGQMKNLVEDLGRMK